MSTPDEAPSLASAIAALSHAAATGCPAWVSPDAWQALCVAVALLTRDAQHRAHAGTRDEAAAALGVRRSTLAAWVRGGWLSGGSGR